MKPKTIKQLSDEILNTVIEKIDSASYSCDRCSKEIPKENEGLFDPFMLDVHGEKVLCNLCDECYADRAAEI